jgi:hypothetical protein
MNHVFNCKHSPIMLCTLLARLNSSETAAGRALLARFAQITPVRVPCLIALVIECVLGLLQRVTPKRSRECEATTRLACLLERRLSVCREPIRAAQRALEEREALRARKVLPVDPGPGRAFKRRV